MKLSELQEKRHKQLDKVLKDVGTSQLIYLIGLIKENQSKGSGVDVTLTSEDENDTSTFTFFETDIEYISTLLSLRKGEEFFRIITERLREKFGNIDTSVLQQTLDMLTAEQWAHVEKIGDTVVNMGAKDIPDITKELERRKELIRSFP